MAGGQAHCRMHTGPRLAPIAPLPALGALSALLKAHHVGSPAGAELGEKVNSPGETGTTLLTWGPR